MIRQADRTLKARWRERFACLPPEARHALRDALNDLRHEALARSEHSWRRHKAPMALYWKVVGVYAGHISRAIPGNPAPGATPSMLSGSHAPATDDTTLGGPRIAL